MSVYTSHHHPDQPSFCMRAVAHWLSGAVAWTAFVSLVGGFVLLCVSLSGHWLSESVDSTISLYFLLGGMLVALIALLFFKGTEPQSS